MKWLKKFWNWCCFWRHPHPYIVFRAVSMKDGEQQTHEILMYRANLSVSQILDVRSWMWRKWNGDLPLDMRVVPIQPVLVAGFAVGPAIYTDRVLSAKETADVRDSLSQHAVVVPIMITIRYKGFQYDINVTKDAGCSCKSCGHEYTQVCLDGGRCTTCGSMIS